MECTDSLCVLSYIFLCSEYLLKLFTPTLIELLFLLTNHNLLSFLQVLGSFKNPCYFKPTYSSTIIYFGKIFSISLGQVGLRLVYSPYETFPHWCLLNTPSLSSSFPQLELTG